MNYQEGTGLTPPHFCSCPKRGLGFPTTYVMVIFVIRELSFFFIFVELLTITV